MDFEITPRMRELQAATREFIQKKIIPCESDPRQTEHGPTEDLRLELAIIMARMPDGTATMFLADMDSEAISIEQQLTALDTCFTGGHAHLRITNLRVSKDDILGEPGRAFHYAQFVSRRHG